ncbi:hypothetical protein AA13595_2112 [Gluconacetobacter johannae DSM 13595]|nr:hypothetical protein AA13595_2112 [Gluconacetobacter johannae DSM 13595]
MADRGGRAHGQGRGRAGRDERAEKTSPVRLGHAHILFLSHIGAAPCLNGRTTGHSVPLPQPPETRVQAFFVT